MTPKQEAAIRRHGEQLLAIFPDATERDPIKLCKRLRRWENRGDRRGLMMCNDAGYTYDEAEAEKDSILKAVHKLLGTDRVWLNGDPRGYALKMDLRSCPVCVGDPHTDAEKFAHDHSEHVPRERLHTDWGGYGIIAPEIGPDGQ